MKTEGGENEKEKATRMKNEEQNREKDRGKEDRTGGIETQETIEDRKGDRKVSKLTIEQGRSEGKIRSIEEIENAVQTRVKMAVQRIEDKIEINNIEKRKIEKSKQSNRVKALKRQRSDENIQNREGTKKTKRNQYSNSSNEKGIDRDKNREPGLEIERRTEDKDKDRQRAKNEIEENREIGKNKDIKKVSKNGESAKVKPKGTSIKSKKQNKTNRIAPLGNNKITKYFTFKGNNKTKTFIPSQNSQKCVEQGTNDPPLSEPSQTSNFDQGTRREWPKHSDLEGGTKNREKRGGTVMSASGEKVIKGEGEKKEVAVEKEAIQL